MTHQIIRFFISYAITFFFFRPHETGGRTILESQEIMILGLRKNSNYIQTHIYNYKNNIPTLTSTNSLEYLK